MALQPNAPVMVLLRPAGDRPRVHNAPVSRSSARTGGSRAAYGQFAAGIAFGLAGRGGFGALKGAAGKVRRRQAAQGVAGARVRIAPIDDDSAAGQHLIGEELVSDDRSASELADRCVAEAERILNSTVGWTEKLKQDGVVVEACPVSGPYARSGVDLVRGSSEFDCSADDFFDFQISKSGFEATDEYLQNHRNVTNYTWAGHPASDADGPNLMLNRVEWPYPLKTREFVSLDLFDRDKRIFVSKSCLHQDRPGGSMYQNVAELDEREFVRAVQYYAVLVEPVSETKCFVKMATWGEMCDNYSAKWVNEFNARLFVVPKFNRFRKCLEMMAEGCDVEEFLSKECSRDIFQVVWDSLKVAPSRRAEVLCSAIDGGSDFVKTMMGHALR